MQKKIYLNLLILCGILSQGNIGTCADEEIKESSNFLVRQKRVINLIPGEDTQVHIRNVPYIVHIKYENRIFCVGSILSNYVVISIAACAAFPASTYNVVCASSRSSRGKLHDVIDIRKKYGNHPGRPNDGIALFIVSPPILYGSTSLGIEVHSGPLLQGVLGTVSGWGVNQGCINRGTKYPTDLRSIKVPIMSHRECVNKYRPHIEISDMDICTYHPQKRCGHNDGGAPLVVDGFLAGMYIWTGIAGHYDSSSYPDVFLMLQHAAYNQWIRTNVENIDLEYQNHHPQ